MNYVWWCLLFVGGTRLSRASIIRRRGYIPADGAPVANYGAGELSRWMMQENCLGEVRW